VIGRALLGLALAAAVAPGAARAGEERLTLAMRGAAFDRDDGGYADHAGAFGLGGAEVGGGGVVEAGLRVAPRVWLYASWSGFTSVAARRRDELRVSNQAFLVQAGATLFRRDELLGPAVAPIALRCDVLAGGGLVELRDQLDGASHRARGPGLRAGAQVTLSWRALGLSVAYGRHFARAALEDRLGGELGAGGNEIGAGLSVRL
jgi:hypothetical protein